MQTYQVEPVYFLNWRSFVKFRPEKYDFDFTQFAQIFKKKFNKSPDFYNKFQ
jgi:hypothetical protein